MARVTVPRRLRAENRGRVTATGRCRRLDARQVIATREGRSENAGAGTATAGRRLVNRLAFLRGRVTLPKRKIFREPLNAIWQA